MTGVLEPCSVVLRSLAGWLAVAFAVAYAFAGLAGWNTPREIRIPRRRRGGRQQREMTEKSCHRNFVIGLIELVLWLGGHGAVPRGVFACNKSLSRQTGSSRPKIFFGRASAVGVHRCASRFRRHNVIKSSLHYQWEDDRNHYDTNWLLIASRSVDLRDCRWERNQRVAIQGL